MIESVGPFPARIDLQKLVEFPKSQSMPQPTLINIFYENRSELLAFMTARLRCPFTAQDLAQDLFLKLFALERSAEVANARAYVFRMAANLVTDHQRRNTRFGGVLVEAEANLNAAESLTSPERQAMAQEELRDLTAAVERLPPKTRRIFKRNRFDGCTQREIAADLGISQTAVEKHIRKALAALSALSALSAHRHRP